MVYCIVLQERKEGRKKVTNITDKCSAGPGPEVSNLGLFLGIVLFAGLMVHGKKRLGSMERAQEENGVPISIS